MKIQLKQELVGWDGSPVELENGLHATIGNIICRALVGAEPGLSEEEIEKRFKFAGELAGLDEYDFGVTELGQVRKRIREHFIVVALTAPALRILEIKGTPA